MQSAAANGLVDKALPDQGSGSFKMFQLTAVSAFDKVLSKISVQNQS